MDEFCICFVVLKDDVGVEIKFSIDCYVDVVEKVEMKNFFLIEKLWVVEKF